LNSNKKKNKPTKKEKIKGELTNSFAVAKPEIVRVGVERRRQIRGGGAQRELIGYKSTRQTWWRAWRYLFQIVFFIILRNTMKREK
jgi:hypothetical protein